MSDQTRFINLRNSTASPDLSDDDEDIYWGEAAFSANGIGGGGGSLPFPGTVAGTLSKWTNYIHGWQDRYFALKTDGNLVYYKSENDTDFGCRGAISIQKANVKAHELDELRFDVSVNDCNWYLRAQSVEDRQRWIDCLEAHRSRPSQQNQQQQDVNNLRRHGSALSLSSNSFSISSRPSGSAKGGRGLTEKLAEMETFRDILCRQIDTLQSYFDTCSEVAQSVQDEETNTDHHPQRLENNVNHHSSVTKDVLVQHGLHAVDFKGEAITFKATTAGILATLSHCIDIMGQREEGWRRKLEKELMARRALEEKYKNAMEFSNHHPADCNMSRPSPSNSGIKHPKTISAMKSIPDYEEGPHSQIGEDEFYDAVENALDRLEEEQQCYDKLKRFSVQETAEVDDRVEEAEGTGRKHPLWPCIDEVTKEQLHYARLLPGQDGVWELFAEDGEMRMYKREEEVDGLVVDPLKALHQVRGVTARELCHFFFSPDVRMEWETTLDQATVLEKISNDTLLFLQLHKRIWPAAQRDACFWSHFRKIPRSTEANGLSPADAHDTYVVCNKSATHPEAPVNQNGILRVDLTIIFVCDTIIDAAKRGLPLDKINRSDLSCKITYCSVINPGGWAPASVLRTVYKREYPRFLKRFTQYVIDKTKGKPIMW